MNRKNIEMNRQKMEISRQKFVVNRLNITNQTITIKIKPENEDRDNYVCQGRSWLKYTPG